MLLLARARGNPVQLVEPMRAAVQAVDVRVVPVVTPMRANYERALRSRRSASLVVGAAGLLALTLACFGIFGVVSYGVAMRTREIGIRRALGADGTSVMALVLSQLTVPVGIGMTVGTAAGLAVGWVLARQPFFLPASDVLTPVLVLAFFSLTALAAAVVPASRALGVEPLRALRHE
jgi:putative ABC transport system permease protein